MSPGQSADGRETGRPAMPSPDEQPSAAQSAVSAAQPSASDSAAQSAAGDSPAPSSPVRRDSPAPSSTGGSAAPSAAGGSPSQPRTADSSAGQFAAGQHPGRGGGKLLLSLRGAAKSFGAVHAIVDGSIDLYGGEAHGLVGENGAGKSTLVKILAGVYQPDERPADRGREPDRAERARARPRTPGSRSSTRSPRCSPT